MRMTPLEIQSHRFGRRLNGLDREEVEAFLRMVTDDYEKVLKENELQRERLRLLEEQLGHLTSQEQLLKQTLMNAQSMSERMRDSADKECDVLLGEAEIRAEKIIDASHRRAHRLAENIRELRGLRAGLAEALKSVMETHLGLVENLTRDPKQEDELIDGLVEGKVTYLSASNVSAPGGARDSEAKQPAVKRGDANAKTSGSA
jgi:cell division initiation protein